MGGRPTSRRANKPKIRLLFQQIEFFLLCNIATDCLLLQLLRNPYVIYVILVTSASKYGFLLNVRSINRSSSSSATIRSKVTVSNLQ